MANWHLIDLAFDLRFVKTVQNQKQPTFICEWKSKTGLSDEKMVKNRFFWSNGKPHNFTIINQYYHKSGKSSLALFLRHKPLPPSIHTVLKRGEFMQLIAKMIRNLTADRVKFGYISAINFFIGPIMQFFKKSLRPIFVLRNTVIQNELLLSKVASFSSGISPVKMAVNIFKSKETDLKAPPLVIMHGLFGSKQNWRAISKALAVKTRRKIYSVDARNHGESPHDDKHSSAHMAADIKLLMQEENLSKISVMGHSMGGRTMMFFALEYPELVEKAIIVDISPVSIPSNLEAMEEIFFAMKNISVSPELPMIEGRKIAESQLKKAVHDKETVDFIMLNLKKLKTGEFVWGPNVAALHANFSQFRIKIKFDVPFTGPVLFIGGNQSGFLNPKDWPEIKELFPNAELEWLDAGHLVHFDQPAKFMDLVTKFLN